MPRDNDRAMENALQNRPDTNQHPAWGVVGDIMAEYPKSEYSRRQIEQAGKRLGQVILHPETAYDEFRIAHNWRMSHFYPMIREQAKLTYLVNKAGGGLTASRIKRMESIRRKLLRGSTNLRDMQDLAGCRAILPDMAGVSAILARYQAADGRVKRINDYIANPKADGYRCAHLIVKFQEDGIGAAYAGQTVELQIRTRLQHAWATAVEAVGAMRNENLKAGHGDAGWLRLFCLMGAYLAEIDGTPVGPHVPSRPEDRSAEIKDLVAQLNAVRNLSTYHEFMRVSEEVSAGQTSYYQVTLDADTGTVKIVPRFIFADFTGYDPLEMDERHQSVTVTANSLDDLRRAYPNYFLDVRLFLEHLKEASQGGHPPKPQAPPVAPRSSVDDLNLSFLKNWRRPK